MATDVSSVTKHFPSAENGFTTTTSGSVSSGATTVGLNSVAGYTNGETVVFVIDPTNAAKKQTFTGVIDTSGVQVTGVVWTAGTNVARDAGVTVVDYATASHVSMMTKGLFRDHNESGYLKTLKDDSGNEWIEQGSTASAVNQVKVTNAATGTSPIISATGDDTNIGLTLTPKGTGSVDITSRSDGWVTGLTAPSTVTANGNRSYNMVFNTLDYTDRLSPGMRLKMTRTVSAPTQCTDLESGSSQYFNKTSPNKLTFTDDFVVSAWVKLESYPTDAIIASRYTGGNGWLYQINSSGQVILTGYNGAVGNYSRVTSYQSVPLNKWVHITAQLDMSAFTATTTTSYVMIDGVDVPASVSRAGSNPTALVQAGNLEIGAFDGASGLFDGKLAQVAIYSAKVTQATILASMNQTLSGSETSLASAYSFNNSIADLNTTTPNDLTAQGSAVATNADSPFALSVAGVPTGTTEYGVITKAAFSTNTTLTVQVPEGGAIPTSGGVSAISYSTHRVPYGFVSQKDKWRVESLIKVVNAIATGVTSTYTSSNFTLTLPIGNWKLGYDFMGGQNNSSGGIVQNSAQLSGATVGAVLDTRDYVYLAQSANTFTAAITIRYRDTNLVQSAAEVFTLQAMSAAGGGTTTWDIRGDLAAGKLFAECAYL